MIKVMLVDDQIILAEGIKSVLETSDDIRVVGVASDGTEAVEMADSLKPDVVLMDIRMPNMNGVAATKKIKETRPECKIIILTTFDDSDYILSAINNGASGYLLKDIGSTALIDAIRNAHAGDTILPSKIAKKITDAAIMVSSDRELKLKRAFGLSEREAGIAMMLLEGFTNRQIAAALKLTDGTSRNYISAIYLKLGVENRTAAISKIKEVIGGLK
ncbi:MAG: response regulator transcription factor [Clostridia bacterium]|nr:response regulator transcription factor [Clostridia bacterium]